MAHNKFFFFRGKRGLLSMNLFCLDNRCFEMCVDIGPPKIYIWHVVRAI